MSNPDPQALAPQLYSRSRPRMQEIGIIVVILVMTAIIWLGAGKVSYNLKAERILDAQGQPVLDENGDPKITPMKHIEERNAFLRAENILGSIFNDMSPVAIMAIGQTIVIISGGIDISVGSIMCLSAFLAAMAVQRVGGAGAPGWEVIATGISVPLVIGLICGLFNGTLVVGLKMHPFIVSLATLSIFVWGPYKLGIYYGSSQSLEKSAFTDLFAEYQRTAHDIHNTPYSQSIPYTPILWMIGCLALGWIYLRYTVWGRETYAVGGNEEAARFSGIRVPWVKLRVYAICGLTAGIAGMLSCGQYKSASTTTGQGYELHVVAAAVVGGASLTGGRGTALGAVLGMMVMQLIDDGIFVLQKVNLGFASFDVKRQDEKLIYGVCIIIAVAIDQFSMNLQSRRSARLRTA